MCLHWGAAIRLPVVCFHPAPREGILAGQAQDLHFPVSVDWINHHSTALIAINFPKRNKKCAERTTHADANQQVFLFSAERNRNLVMASQHLKKRIIAPNCEVKRKESALDVEEKEAERLHNPSPQVTAPNCEVKRKESALDVEEKEAERLHNPSPQVTARHSAKLSKRIWSKEEPHGQ